MLCQIQEFGAISSVEQSHNWPSEVSSTGLVFWDRQAVYFCYTYLKEKNNLWCKKNSRGHGTTLCLSLCICASITHAINYCTNNIRLPKHLFVIIEAGETPRILVIVVSKKIAVRGRGKITPRPSFRNLRSIEEWVMEENEFYIVYSTRLSSKVSFMSIFGLTLMVTGDPWLRVTYVTWPWPWVKVLVVSWY